MIAAHFTTLSGVPEGLDALYIARYAEQSTYPTVHIALNDARVAAIRAAIKFFAPHITPLIYPAWDCMPYDRISPSPRLIAERVATVIQLQQNIQNTQNSAPILVLTTINAVLQKLPPLDLIRTAHFAVRTGGRIDVNALKRFLSTAGFNINPTVNERGDYSVRGGLIDIYPFHCNAPIRIDLFGDHIDAIRCFNPTTQRSTNALSAIDLFPGSEINLDQFTIQNFRQNYRARFGTQRKADPLYEAISNGQPYQGFEHWLPLFYDSLDTFFAVIPHSKITMDEHTHTACRDRWTLIDNKYQARLDNRHNEHNDIETNNAYKPIPPELLYITEQEWQAHANKHKIAQFITAQTPDTTESYNAGGRIGYQFTHERQNKDISIFTALADYIRKHQSKKRIVIASYSEGMRQRLCETLREDHAITACLIDDVSAVVKTQANDFFAVVWPLDQGFETDDIIVLAEQDILGARNVRKIKTKRSANALHDTHNLTIGDLVVHSEHGIGRYLGLETVRTDGKLHDCVVLEYAARDRLLWPIENIELLSRYGQNTTAPLDQLGTAHWQMRKARLRKRIRDIAEHLLKTAAQRAINTAPHIPIPEQGWDRFLALFPYQETDDQAIAINHVIEDLQSGRLMDRLIVGDVGFGKTEIAMRAAFMTVMAGFQVAIIAPTTLLVRQHYQVFKERFAHFPIQVKQLSRFVTTAEARKTEQQIKNGSTDIVIGTHALLSKRIEFHRLGLLVVDEEQKFGVTHKERLKTMRISVHVLTLSATPIPRTLQMSLSGLRDLSVMTTPPIDRLSHRTFVTEFDPITIRDALLREHYRRGQSFFVVPRIADIAKAEEFLRERVPEITYHIAHGQLPNAVLDARMNDFYDGRYNVLLATTIVELGLDIPTANTLIVYRADAFGLAQLYQIRGRVGRSKQRAYVYLTTVPNKTLTINAQKRLRALSRIAELGAGFALASQDLEIRGAGNLLGEEQSGTIREVGQELYLSMLEDTIKKVKTEGLTKTDTDIALVDDDWSPTINLGLNVLIPESYVPDLSVRFGLYRRLSALTEKAQIEEFAAEMIDRFGDLPPEVNTLLLVVRIKALCKKARILQLDTGQKGVTLRFYQNRFVAPEALLDYVKNTNNAAAIRGHKVVFHRQWQGTRAKVKGVFSIVRDLARLANHIGP